MNIAEPFQVTYYADAALTQPIGTTTIDPTICGCARHTYSATINWSGLSQGEHDYWVKIDGSNDVDESMKPTMSLWAQLKSPVDSQLRH